MTPATSVEKSGPKSPEEQAPPGPYDAASIHPTDPMTQENHPQTGRRKGYRARSTRNIDSVIRAKKASDERWLARNQQVIEYLDKGLSIREVSRLVGRGERQIRVARERLADLRAASTEEPQKNE